MRELFESWADTLGHPPEVKDSRLAWAAWQAALKVVQRPVLSPPSHGAYNKALVLRSTYESERARSQALAEFHRAAMRMCALLADHEWAEHVSKDKDAMELESQITELHNEISEHRERSEALEEALRELVAVKAIKDEIERLANLPSPDLARLNEMNSEYRRRQPAAWAAARAIVGDAL